MKGRVKWWSNESGCGFIEYDNNGDIFVHVENKEQNKIQENQEIEFIIEEKENGRFLKLLKTAQN
jgi:cold shock CspA family protein